MKVIFPISTLSIEKSRNSSREARSDCNRNYKEPYDYEKLSHFVADMKNEGFRVSKLFQNEVENDDIVDKLEKSLHNEELGAFKDPGKMAPESGDNNETIKIVNSIRVSKSECSSLIRQMESFSLSETSEKLSGSIKRYDKNVYNDQHVTRRYKTIRNYEEPYYQKPIEALNNEQSDINETPKKNTECLSHKKDEYAGKFLKNC